MRSIILIFISLSLTGCAAMFGKRTQEVKFDSIPVGAKVFIGSKFVGNTPVVVKIKNKPSYEITYILADKSENFTIRPVTETPHAVNKFFCMLDIAPGMIFFGMPVLIDMANGSCKGFYQSYLRKID